MPGVLLGISEQMQNNKLVNIEIIAPPGIGDFVASALRLVTRRFGGNIDIFEMTVRSQRASR